MMKIGFVQTSPRFGEKQENFRHVKEMLAGCQADLLVLPELFATGYAFNSREEAMDLSEKPGEETSNFLLDLASMCNSTVVGGFIEHDNGNCYNSAIMADGSGILAIYRKLHLFNKEKLWFNPGDRAPEVYTVRGVKIGMMICFDWIFPETCRTLALKGAQVIAHPSNLVLPWAQQAMVIRCLENHCYAVTANRIGREQRGTDDFTFTGSSQITGCQGGILASASGEKACIQIVEIEPEEALNKKVNPYNDLFNDRRSRYYSL